ncbi:hypothetical protein B0T19DRAFT_216707 [Cercophora scortea]|uniref:C2H2-type domain-containing protein n=1 Tax=Cercophora scortea TaxID=314031 RepID=A0AAE0M9W7_9PEZI|nr:hypothetical protein B0T19DRAFT_216707 [Cercophora scortea]
MGLLEKLAQSCQRRGYAECVDTNYRQSVRDQGMRHKANSTVYQEYYNNARMNAVVRDAFLGRGTQTPYLAIFNHMGLRLDENAPKRVPDEMMHMIGPSAAVRRLEQELEALEAALRQMYGRPSWAPDDKKEQYESIKAQLRTTRQKQRRKVFRMTYKDYFTESDDKELQNQLQGIQESVVEREITHSLPERRVLADRSGTPHRAPKQGPAQSTPSPSAPETPSRSPPPSYSKADLGAGHHPTVSARAAAITPCPRRSPYTRKKPDPCIFCGKTYTRTDALWDHLEDHFERAGGGPLACLREECKGIVLESLERFKAHAARFHGSSFRPVKSESGTVASPRPITPVSLENQARPPDLGPVTPGRTRIALRRTTPPKIMRSAPKIILTQRERRPSPSPRIILRVGKGRR